MDLSVLTNALTTVTQDVYHYEKIGTAEKYIVWAEDGAGTTQYGDDEMTEQNISGTIDYFTRTEHDPNFGKIQKALNGICAWELLSVQRESDTGYIHYEWGFEIENGESDLEG